MDVSSQVEPHRQQTRELTALSNIDNLTEDVFYVFLMFVAVVAAYTFLLCDLFL